MQDFNGKIIMKLRNLLEARTGTHEVDVDFEFEHETEEDVEYIPMTARVRVLVTPDMYATGDSPTGYEPEIRYIVDQSGKRVSPKLPRKQEEWIEDKAIRMVRED